MSSKGWIGFDLDGTLAVYDHFEGPCVIGKPIPAMIEKVRQYMRAGHEVKIFTARVSSDGTATRDLEAAHARIAITEWCINVLGYPLPITNVKDYSMWVLYDDRAIQVQKNTGVILGDEASLGMTTTP